VRDPYRSANAGASQRTTIRLFIRSRFRGRRRRKVNRELDALPKGKVRAAPIAVNLLESMTFMKKAAIFGKSSDSKSL